ncbi:MAG TPA: hypothetical protein VLG25_00125 [Patescibacteria group bacterium]|nr:hypothetical protein [Patescibacteria group bacterium]
MDSKYAYYIAITIFSGIGSWLGSLIDHGNFLGWWSFLFGTIGALVGIWALYRINTD